MKARFDHSSLATFAAAAERKRKIPITVSKAETEAGLCLHEPRRIALERSTELLCMFLPLCT